MATMAMIVLATVAKFGIALLAGLFYGERLHSFYLGISKC